MMRADVNRYRLFRGRNHLEGPKLFPVESLLRTSFRGRISLLGKMLKSEVRDIARERANLYTAEKTGIAGDLLSCPTANIRNSSIDISIMRTGSKNCHLAATSVTTAGEVFRGSHSGIHRYIDRPTSRLGNSA
jgi:hypothetical protein